ncbi:hypothetical protein [Butyrivibrio sp. FCS014]|uniref:hypothetical protein n=1 Tax=Butyrivibrio sp. FCS014 TaxID=1408304 RepID=UPI0004653B2A|nr:hypothetical protein [Butyrivibrio sp. FCS014]
MSKYACSPEGVEQLKAAAGKIKQGADEIKTQTTTMRSIASGYSDTLGPHRTELEEALDEIAGAVAQCIEPAENVCQKLNSVAQKYEGIIGKKRFQRQGN